MKNIHGTIPSVMSPNVKEKKLKNKCCIKKTSTNEPLIDLRKFTKKNQYKLIEIFGKSKIIGTGTF